MSKSDELSPREKAFVIAFIAVPLIALLLSMIAWCIVKVWQGIL